MAVEVKMPQLGESVHEGMIGKWLKSEGDPVEEYEPLLEVVTDKVDTEVTAVATGTLLEILVSEGETVEVGTVLARIGEAGEQADEAGTMDADESPGSGAPPSRPAAERGDGQPAAAADDAPAAQPARISPVASRVAAEHGIDPASVEGTGRSGQVTRADVERAVESAASKPTEPPDVTDEDVGFISPRVARLAATHGVDLRRIDGSGRDGRITARDVEAYVAQREEEPSVATERATTTARPQVPASKRDVEPVTSRADELIGEVVPLTPMRKMIAEHMVRSKQTSPHVSTVHEVDMSRAMAAYRDQKEEMAARGVRLTLTAVIIDAVARTLRKHPIVNSSWTDEGIHIHEGVNIGMAVAVDKGLIVPVIHHADEKNLVGLAREINDLAERARSSRLTPDDVSGGTFTITNYGTLGSLFGTPVINQPQAAILGTGAIKKRVVVVRGPDGGDQMAIRPMMYLALTFDHRMLDGGTADPFMQSLVSELEDYEV